MKEYIIDVNVDIEAHQAQYPKYFFDDLRKPKKVKIVIGGTDYIREIKGKTKLFELILTLISAQKIRRVDDTQVDLAQERLKRDILSAFESCPKECDDHHIFALSMVSGCINIITKDTRMASCRNSLRGRLPQDSFPGIRVISSAAAYSDS